jgi:hypothetical protein
MTKSEFKKLYSGYRKTESQFRERMSSGSYPCGYDDMIYYQFEESRDDYLSTEPVLKAIVEALSCGDRLEDRALDLAYTPKTSYRWDILKNSIRYGLSA